MKKILILASLLMGWSQIVIAEPGDAAAGEANSVVCSACHGADGNSAVASFPKLAGLGEKYLLKQLMDIRDGGRPIATMVGLLDEKSDQDLDHHRHGQGRDHRSCQGRDECSEERRFDRWFDADNFCLRHSNGRTGRQRQESQSRRFGSVVATHEC